MFLISLLGDWLVVDFLWHVNNLTVKQFDLHLIELHLHKKKHTLHAYLAIISRF